MATPRDIRRIAFLTLFQLDARSESDRNDLKLGLRDTAGNLGIDANDAELEKAFDFAVAAYEARESSDRALLEYAPTWPAKRQPAVDRAILRLAYYEMSRGTDSPKIAVNEAVELAKVYGTERSPAFVNGVLDKVLKKVLSGSTSETPGETTVGSEER